VGYLCETNSETSLNKMFYDYEKERFTDKDKNFLRYINDSSTNLSEFTDFVGYHRDGFESIIKNFEFLIDCEQTDEEGKDSMKIRIEELMETIQMLNYVLKDIKENPFDKQTEPQLE